MEESVAQVALVRQVLELLPEPGVLVLVHAGHVLVERADWDGRPDE